MLQCIVQIYASLSCNPLPFHRAVSLSEGTSRSTYEAPFESDGEKVGGPLSYAFDDDPSTCFHSTEDNQPEWLQLTLSRPARVKKVIIINR